MMELLKPMLPMLVGQLQKTILSHQESYGGSIVYSLSVLKGENGAPGVATPVLILKFWGRKDGKTEVLDTWDSARLLSEFNISKLIEGVMEGDSGAMGFMLKMAMSSMPELTVNNAMVEEVLGHLAGFLFEIGQQEAGHVYVELTTISRDKKKFLGISRGEKTELEMTIAVLSGGARRVLDRMPADQFVGVLLDRAMQAKPAKTVPSTHSKNDLAA